MISVLSTTLSLSADVPYHRVIDAKPSVFYKALPRKMIVLIGYTEPRSNVIQKGPAVPEGPLQPTPPPHVKSLTTA